MTKRKHRPRPANRSEARIVPVLVSYENGDAVVAKPDERELARFESEHGNVRTAIAEIPHAFMRFCAYHALRRDGHTLPGFETWCDTVVSIRDADR